MVVAGSEQNSSLYRAATAAFNYADPTQALSDVLRLATDLLGADRAALYESDERGLGFSPRLGYRVAVRDLGRIGAAPKHAILRTALTDFRAASASGVRESLGLPLAPGAVAVAPARNAERIVGLIIVARDRQEEYTPDELKTLEALGTRAADIMAFARQTANQSYLFQKLSLLYGISHQISTTRDLQETIRLTADHLLKATTADCCEVMVFDVGNGESACFRQQVSKSLGHAVVSSVESIPAYPIHQEVLEELRPSVLSVSPPIGTSEDIAMLQDQGVASTAVFPLATHKQALGLVHLIYDHPRRGISGQEVELAQAIISIGAMGLQDAIHIEDSRARATQLQVLGDIGRDMTSTLDLEVALENAMRHIQQLFQVEASILFLVDESGENLVLKASGDTPVRIRDVEISLADGIAGWVARHKKPLIVNDVYSNPLFQSSVDGQTGLLTTSVLCVPLEARGEVLGVIEAINHPRAAFTPSDQQMLSSVASWAAIALDNANLFRSIADERRRLEATLVETMDAVVLTDSKGKIILINKAAAQAFRVREQDATGEIATAVFHDTPLGRHLVDPDIELPKTIEITTPTDRILSASVSEITDVGRVAVMQDITTLKQIDRMRSQLLGTAAHDLKNPLNAIRLGADLLQHAELTQQQHSALNMMQRATGSMADLISGLLDTIRVESTANMVFESISIKSLIDQAVGSLNPLIEDKGHTLQCDEPPDDLTVLGDAGRLNSVITNLVSNAVKFTDPGGQIEIDVYWDNSDVVVSVIDNGPGIPKDEIPRVFDPLFRGQAVIRDPNNPVDGTGLGLALAKTAVEQHSGRIWVTSNEGEGSNFSFSLPLERAHQNSDEGLPRLH